MGIVVKDILAIVPEDSTQRNSPPAARVVSLYIDGELIVGIDKAPPEFAAERTIDGAGKLMIPGLVNAHTHAYMSYFRNWADDVDFDTWLFKRVMPVEDKLVSEDAYWGAQLSMVEMLRGGVTSFLDMHMFPYATVNAATELGMRAVVSRGLSGGESDKAGGARRIKEALDEYNSCANLSRLVTFMIAPHAVTTCDEGYMREIADTARELRLGIHTHLAEGGSETVLAMEKYGCSPAELYDRCGLLSDTTVAAHCVHLSDSDIDLLAERGVSIAVNHGSNLKLANGISPVPRLLERGVNLCLGTDSAASNNSLSILREIGLVSLLHKGLTGDPTVISASDAFLMATRNGARALGLSDVGEIRVGYRADLAIFDIQRPELVPIGDPIAALSYSNSGMTADTVICNGSVLMQNGEFTNIDVERIIYEVTSRAQRLGLTDK